MERFETLLLIWLSGNDDVCFEVDSMDAETVSKYMKRDIDRVGLFVGVIWVS